MPPILNAQGLTKAFGATALFRDIAFTVSDGDRIGLIGPNGAGKSTLLKVLAAHEDADAGDVAVRKRRSSPLRDVAGILRSFDYAPGVGLMERSNPEEPEWDRLVALGDAWTAVRTIPARKGLVLTDTCHSAGVQLAGRGGEATTRANSQLIDQLKKTDAQGVGYLWAADQTEVSLEDPELNQGQGQVPVPKQWP